MKILLIQPKMTKRPMDTDLKVQMSPPLGLYTLVTLTPPECEVSVINENIEAIPKNVTADLVGISITLDVFPRACEIAERFRSQGIPVVAGGIHVTCSPQMCMARFDAICVGPAERVWARIVHDAQNHDLKQEYRDFDGFRGDEVASPAYRDIGSKKYLFTNVVTTSRGCPNRCDFCYNSSENQIHVRRPIADVIADISKLSTRHVYFVDDNFIGDPKYTWELLKALEPLGLKWNAAVTARILDHLDLLDFMAKTGCQSLFIGLESINDRALKSVHKGNEPEKYERLVKEIHDRGIMLNASMVFGLDGDGPEVFDMTLKWLVENRVETLTSHILTPYPGTRLHSRLEQEGRITDDDLAHYNTASVVFKPLEMDPEELHRGYIRMYRKFYSLKNIFARRPISVRQKGPYFLFNFLYRKYGRAVSMICKVIPMGRIGRLVEKWAYKV